jgi:hypothetical protein
MLWMLPKTTGLATSDRARARPLALLLSCERRRRGVRGVRAAFAFAGKETATSANFASGTD